MSGNQYRPSESTAHAYDAEPRPILDAWPEYALFEGSGKSDYEAEKSNMIEAIAIAYGGQGYRPHPELGEGRERKR